MFTTALPTLMFLIIGCVSSQANHSYDKKILGKQTFRSFRSGPLRQITDRFRKTVTKKRMLFLLEINKFEFNRSTVGFKIFSNQKNGKNLQKKLGYFKYIFNDRQTDRSTCATISDPTQAEELIIEYMSEERKILDNMENLLEQTQKNYCAADGSFKNFSKYLGDVKFFQESNKDEFVKVAVDAKAEDQKNSYEALLDADIVKAAAILSKMREITEIARTKIVSNMQLVSTCMKNLNEKGGNNPHERKLHAAFKEHYSLLKKGQEKIEGILATTDDSSASIIDRFQILVETGSWWNTHTSTFFKKYDFDQMTKNYKLERSENIKKNLELKAQAQRKDNREYNDRIRKKKQQIFSRESVKKGFFHE